MRLKALGIWLAGAAIPAIAHAAPPVTAQEIDGLSPVEAADRVLHQLAEHVVWVQRPAALPGGIIPGLNQLVVRVRPHASRYRRLCIAQEIWIDFARAQTSATDGPITTEGQAATRPMFATGISFVLNSYYALPTYQPDQVNRADGREGEAECAALEGQAPFVRAPSDEVANMGFAAWKMVLAEGPSSSSPPSCRVDDQTCTALPSIRAKIRAGVLEGMQSSYETRGGVVLEGSLKGDDHHWRATLLKEAGAWKILAIELFRLPPV